MRRFGIIGNPLAQSPSKEVFDAHFSKTGVDAEFHIYELENLNDFRAFLFRERPEGLLVTIPYKEEVFAMAAEKDHPDLLATNMISIRYENDDVFIRAHNTDFTAFFEDLETLSPDMSKPALIIGDGGAAKAVVYALKAKGYSYSVWGRKDENGKRVWQDCPAHVGELGLVINTTPLGMAPLENECPPLDYTKLTPGCIAYDLVYKPAETLFLLKCKAMQCKTANGRGMLDRVYRMAMDMWKLS